MRTIRPVLAVGFLAIVLAACGNAATGGLPGQAAGPQSAIGDTPGNGYLEQPGASAAPAAPDDDGFGNANQIGARDDARIIRTGSIQLEVGDVPTALRTARDAIVSMGGYVGASNTSNSDEQPFAEIVYRIPADRWEDALDVLRNLNGLTKKVVNEQTQAVEVTGQVIDLEARIKNLRASETALQTIAANAVKVSDVLDVEARLTDVRGQIEQLTAQLVDLNDRAAFTTLTAYFSTPVVAVELANKDWQPATTVDEATASLISIVQGLANAGIWFLIVWVPVLLVLGLVSGLVVWFARRLGLGRRRDGSSLLPPPPAAPGAVADTWR
jgi:Domain of unknown function (DUF4349)